MAQRPLHHSSWSLRYLSAPSFWEWVVAVSTAITRWSLSESWVLTLKELRNLLPSFMYMLSITLPKLSTPDTHFPELLSTVIRRRFQVKPATLLIPVDSFLVLLVAELYDTQYQSSFLSLIMWGVAFTACVVFLFFCRGFCAVPLLCATGFGV